MKNRFVTYLYWNYARNEFVLVNYGSPYSCSVVRGCTSIFLKNTHESLKDTILLDVFEEFRK